VRAHIPYTIVKIIFDNGILSQEPSKKKVEEAVAAPLETQVEDEPSKNSDL